MVAVTEWCLSVDAVYVVHDLLLIWKVRVMKVRFAGSIDPTCVLLSSRARIGATGAGRHGLAVRASGAGRTKRACPRGATVARAAGPRAPKRRCLASPGRNGAQAEWRTPSGVGAGEHV